MPRAWSSRRNPGWRAVRRAEAYLNSILGWPPGCRALAGRQRHGELRWARSKRQTTSPLRSKSPSRPCAPATEPAGTGLMMGAETKMDYRRWPSSSPQDLP